MDVYQDIFTGWADVQSEFSTDAPEPFRVLYARYSYEDHSGDADVFWQNEDGTFGYVSGGHCSCWGLEGQWEPETYTAEQLAGQLERARCGFFAFNRPWLTPLSQGIEASGEDDLSASSRSDESPVGAADAPEPQSDTPS